MTRMSETPPRSGSRISCKRARSQEGSALAQGVHAPVPAVKIALLLPLGGCLLGPSLSVENQDAGVNSPPAILGVRGDDQELPEPGPVIFTVGSGMLSIELLDTDLTDTLFVRAFVNYTFDAPTPPRMFCSAPPNGKAQRTIGSCVSGTICEIADVSSDPNETLDLHITVFDREPLEAGDPPFQAMPQGGLSTNRYYKLGCRQ